jgi:hypothetical protein
MPSHGSSRQHTAALPYSFPSEAWCALVRLPGQVAVAATGVGETGSRDAVAGTLAGLGAIAAGRGCASLLVRDVVGAIYLEDPASRYRPSADVLAACGAAASALSTGGAWREDTEAYQHWIESIAARVCQVANTDAVFDTGGPALTPVQWRFLAELRAAFAQ